MSHKTNVKCYYRTCLTIIFFKYFFLNSRFLTSSSCTDRLRVRSAGSTCSTRSGPSATSRDFSQSSLSESSKLTKTVSRFFDLCFFISRKLVLRFSEPFTEFVARIDCSKILKNVKMLLFVTWKPAVNYI